MVLATFTNDQLVLEMQGWDRILALKDRLEIPVANIESIDIGISREDRLRSSDLRMLGTSLPGSVQAGIFRHGGRWVFWDVHHAGSDNAIVIHLTDNPYAQVVVEVARPQDVVSEFEQMRTVRR